MRYRPSGGLVLLLATLMIVAVAPSAAVASRGEAPGLQLQPAAAHNAAPRGQAAIDRIGSRLPAVARNNGLSTASLRALFLSDLTLSVDGGDQLFYVDQAYGEVSSSSPESSSSEAPPTTDPVFSLHSRPGADHVIYLDFDGHTTVNTSWNGSYGTTLVSPPYNIDGNPDSWNSTEITRIRDVWNIVSEDFAPFEVDVTTEEPPVDRLMKSGAGDTQWGVRVVITADVWAGCGCGGFAYINSFNWSSDTPVFVFNSSLSGVSEAASHEAGHGLGLAHDGTSSVTYYYGHGTGDTGWAPIMGAGYNRIVTQWSQGEYYQANNNTSSGNYGKGADDLAVITTYNGFGYRPDDHGNTLALASPLGGSPVDTSGVIEATSDVDVFEFTTGGGSVSLTIERVVPRPNINIRATLKDSSGTQIALAHSATSLSESFNLNLAAGTYYLSVDGIGMGDPMISPPTGHADYGNIGQYTITGTIPEAASTVVVVIGDYGDDSTAEGDVAALVNGWNPDAVITAGDNRYGATTFDQVVGAFYCDFLANVPSGSSCSGGNSATNRYFPTAGNHDYTDGGGLGEYLSYFDLPGAGVVSSGSSGTERYYDYVVGPIHFFAVDSQGALTDGADMTAQQAWLQTQLGASTSPWQVVVMHHPPYSSGTHQSSTAMRWPYAAWGADAVVAGHDHDFERISASGIPYFVNGLGGRSIRTFGTTVAGSEVRYNGDYGAMQIEADAGQLTFRFVNLSGQIVDSHTVLPTPPGVVDIAVSSGDDDVEERASDGVLDFSSTDIELGEDGGFNGVQTVGLLFRSVAVPQGATIDVAYLEFTADETDSGVTDVVIRAQDADNAASFAAVVNDVTDRPTTGTSIPWSIPVWDTIGAAHQSPDLGAIIEPIVGRGGWSQGNNLVFVIDGVGERTAESYNGSSGEAARLHIEYTYVPNDPPAAEFASSTADLTATFTDASSDTDGTIVSWAWDFGDSGSSTLQNPGHTYGAGGTYSVELTVTDDRGGTDSTTHSVTVTDPPPPNDPPTAAFTSEVTNLAATFTDTSTDPDGTVVSWAWDFGDTATSSMQNPSHFYAAAGTYFVALTVTDDDGDTGTASSSVTITAPPPLTGGVYLSFKSTVTIGGVTAQDEDILHWDGATTYTLAFDGSDVGLTGFEIDGFDVVGSNQVLLSFTGSGTVPDIGSVADSDIVRFTGSLGAATSGTFEMYFDGSDVGAAQKNEDIDRLTLLDDGSLLISTTGNYDLAGLSGTDADVIRFTGTFGSSTSGSFSLYFDGSDVEMTNKKEDIDALASDGIDLHFSTLDTLNALGVTAADEDAVTFSGTFGSSTSGTFASYWDGSSHGTTNDLGGLDIVTGPPPPNDPPTAGFTFSTADLTATFTDASSDTDGSVVLWAWDFGDSNTSTVEDPGHTYTAAGTYTVSLLVTDDDGDTDSISQSVTVTEPPNDPPTAGFTFSTADLTATFTDASSDTDGSVVLWAWDFGDSNTSTVEDPGHTYTAAGTYTVSLLVTDDDGDTDSISQSVTVTDPPPLGDGMYFAFKAAVTLGGVTVTEQDILHWDGAATYTLAFDGSDVGLGSLKIDGLDVIGPGQVLLSFKDSGTLPDIGAIDDSDIVLFTGTLGPATSGTFSMYFDASDVGLDNKREDIDAFTLLADGSLLISTKGSFSVSGASGEDEDVIRFVGIFGSSTSGSFSLHFDGSDVSMTDKKEDIDALASDGTDLYFSVIDNFSAGGVTADAEDVLTFSGTFGASTSGTFGIFWAGIAHGTTTSVVGFDRA